MKKDFLNVIDNNEPGIIICKIKTLADFASAHSHQ